MKWICNEPDYIDCSLPAFFAVNEALSAPTLSLLSVLLKLIKAIITDFFVNVKEALV